MKTDTSTITTANELLTLDRTTKEGNIKKIQIYQNDLTTYESFDTKMKKVHFLSTLKEFHYSKDHDTKSGQIFRQRIADFVGCRFQMVRSYLLQKSPKLS